MYFINRCQANFFKQKHAIESNEDGFFRIKVLMGLRLIIGRLLDIFLEILKQRLLEE